MVNLEILNEGNTKTVVTESKPLLSDFQTYIPRVQHMKAECIVDNNELGFIDYKKTIVMKATILIHKEEGTLKVTLEEKISPSRSSWKGFYKFWDILSA